MSQVFVLVSVDSVSYRHRLLTQTQTQTTDCQLVLVSVATGKPIGLILNFGESKVEVKRKVKDLK
ncbi:MAG: hypothetical protein HY607_03385 [Planctomycetes bacterium]|nr:hypothetical protein [Planctomycetota bacterium]